MAAAKKDGDVRVGKKHKKPVPVPLSEDEITAKQVQIQKNLTRIVKLNEEMQPFKDKKKEVVDENEKLRIQCETKKEERETYVVNEFHFKQNKVIVKLFDTAEQVEERPMSEEERQEEFGDKLSPAGEDDGEGESPAN